MSAPDIETIMRRVGELYLTDVVKFARGRGLSVHSMVLADRWQTEGVNDRVQLARMNAEVNRRLVEHWMREGVTVLDPQTTWIEADVDLASDVTILPNTQLLGASSIATGASGPTTSGRANSAWADSGITAMASTLGQITGPPAEKLYAVEPVGVETTMPSQP